MLPHAAALPSPNGRTIAPELDVLRGLAALLMIFNHAGFALLSTRDATDSASGVAVFIGSFAPVIFFFATGFGIALASGSKARRFDAVALLWKVLLLVVADQFFFWKRGAAWGIDFFSFIGLSTVVVTLISQLRRSTAVCIALGLLLVGLRYGLGPALRSQLNGSSVLDWVLGVTTVADVSYPLSPWLIYPLLGFMLGRMYLGVDLHSRRSRNRWVSIGVALVVIAFGLSLEMASLHTGFFRWGTVSSAFFILSLGVLLSAGLLSMYLAKAHPRIANALALRGVASFAVIPIHYALLTVGAALLSIPVGQGVFQVSAIVIAMVSVFLASRFSGWVSVAILATSVRLLLLLLMPALAAVAVTMLLHTPRETMQTALLLLTGQLVVATLLGVRVSRLATPRV